VRAQGPLPPAPTGRDSPETTPAKTLWQHAEKPQAQAPWRAIVREFGINEAVAQDAHRTHKLPPGITGDAVTRFLELPASCRNALMHGMQQSIGAAVAGILHELGDPASWWCRRWVAQPVGSDSGGDNRARLRRPLPLPFAREWTLIERQASAEAAAKRRWRRRCGTLTPNAGARRHRLAHPHFRIVGG
jgi:hypothetical protein